jgi:hypothetical protein
VHPILTSLQRLGIYLAAWIPMGLLLSALVEMTDGRPWTDAVALALPLALVYAFLCLASWFVCRASPLGEVPVLRLLAAHGIAAVTTSGLWLAIGAVWASVISGLGVSPLASERFRSDLPIFFVVGLLLFVLAVAVHYLLMAFESSRAAQQRALELQVLAREAQLRALKAQVNPHFLFNSLNSIGALAGSDPAASRRMCLLLSEFLRSSLRLGAREAIPLSEEVAIARSFLAIEQVRFGERLRVETEIEPGAARCLVPPLLIQPLVENAVSHGIARLIEGGVVRITARRTGDRLEISVENPRDPDAGSARGEGLGLANVRERLEALDPTNAKLDVQAGRDFFRATALLPAVEAQVMDETAA